MNKQTKFLLKSYRNKCRSQHDDITPHESKWGYHSLDIDSWKKLKVLYKAVWREWELIHQWNKIAAKSERNRQNQLPNINNTVFIQNNNKQWSNLNAAQWNGDIQNIQLINSKYKCWDDQKGKLFKPIAITIIYAYWQNKHPIDNPVKLQQPILSKDQINQLYNKLK